MLSRQNRASVFHRNTELDVEQYRNIARSRFARSVSLADASECSNIGLRSEGIDASFVDSTTHQQQLN